MSKQKQAFTLVELVITILILAILGTIAFFSFQGYSRSSRDSVRISDMQKMKNALEIFMIESGKYPEPTDGKIITFSGGSIWQQGLFGESTFTNVDKLNKIPKDPLLEKEYTYSVTMNRTQFQLGGISEGSNLTYFDPISQSYAGDRIMNALVVGNYNGFISKTLIDSECYVLTVPTIISNDIDTSTDYEEIVNNKRLVFNGFQNIPGNFKNTKYNIDGGFDFDPNDLIVYSDSDNCQILDTDETLRIDLLKSIQNSYSGTALKNTEPYSQLLGLQIRPGSLNNSTNVKGLAGNIGRIVLGKKVTVTYSMDNMMGLCSFDGKNLNNGDTVTAYLETFIDDNETYDCQSISQERVCADGQLSGSGEYENYSCLKGGPDNCNGVVGYNHNGHLYSLPTTEHLGELNNFDEIVEEEDIVYINSQPVSENDGRYIYKLNNLSCNDGSFTNIQEDLLPTILSCDVGYISDGETCVFEGSVNISSGDTIVCPACAP